MGDTMPESDSQKGSDAFRDFSKPATFDLRRQKPDKTVDIGLDGVSLSLDACGRSMLQWIQGDRPGLGLSFRSNPSHVSINIPNANVATFQFTLEDDVQVSLQVDILEGGDIFQRTTITNHRTSAYTLACDVNLCVSLNRASYGQLTEGGPIALPKSRNTFSLTRQDFVKITNAELGAQLTGEMGRVIELDGDLVSVEWPSSDQEAIDAPLDLNIPFQFRLKPSGRVSIENRFRLRAIVDANQIPSYSFDETWGKTLDPESDCLRQSYDQTACQKYSWLHPSTVTTYILRRNVEYILANCTIPVGSTTTDNYWQLRLLYSTHNHAPLLLHSSSIPSYTSHILKIAKGHLTWVFRTAQRPNTYWHRSYLVTGTPKDAAVFQLDQQCYPLLELCDFADTFASEAAFAREILEFGVVEEIIELLREKRDMETGLWPTDETPADDAVTHPFHFSSHVLLWRTLTRLAHLYTLLYSASHPCISPLTVLADALRTATLAHFTIPYPHAGEGESMFAYLTDGKGNHTLYHDANDLPTLFALPWSFLSTPSQHAAYHATLSFAFSPANSAGYVVDQPYPGLGSVHSPGAWVLGYFQEAAYAAMVGNDVGLKRAWAKVKAAMQWDGTFGEAVDARTGRVTSKAWFSWPGAMVGALVVQLRAEAREGVLLGEGL
ncbi:uncharacterized protein CC84DRAFT_1200017 [Paraphaeosphaeria sporulosa]|uniref:Glycoside hydrolase family 78 protein n=1 Tax=Paraphaeosphaeria sporulosa TaxID=1460663 RepID=A0A177BY40_9PLEO|nr:uncharacterized protein CC84DRAFT_1200017 [Paraphaeosphaeria sporulosa]OAF99316.1 hypothetical protein CC84DRAFT_1200017 [Paraphaeosphaeria sporulosa]